MRKEILLSLLATIGLYSNVRAAEMPPEAMPPHLVGLINYSVPHYPVGLRGVMAGDAQVVLAFTVDADGKVVDCVAIEATRPEFANAAESALMEWRFEPSVAGKMLPRREVVEFAFRRTGVVTTVQHVDAAREEFASTTAHPQIRTVKLSELDAEPKRTAAAMPALSKAQLSQQGNSPLMINFVIDADGNVRVPVVTSSDPVLADSVLKAVKQWRYVTPTQNGSPVLVEMTRSLVLTNAGVGKK